MGCLVRLSGIVVLSIVLAILARRTLEHPAPIPPAGPSEKDTVVDGVRWRSREAPGRRSEPVVYVHGLFSSSATWKKVLVSASGGRAAVAVDLPGFGYSDRPWPHDYTVAGQAQALLRYLEERGLDNVTCVGNSLGGGVCLIAAAARPQRIRALVLADSASPRARVPWPFRLLRTPVVGEIEMQLFARPVMEFALRKRLYARSERVTAETIDDWWLPITVPGTRRAALAAIRSSSRGYENLLEKVSAPTLVVWGKEDRLLPPEEGFRLSSAIPGSRLLVLPDTGHLPQEEAPEQFSRALSEFLDETSRR